MTRAEFSRFVESTLESAIQFAETHSGRPLPRRIAFAWMGRKMDPIQSGVIEEIVNRVFVDEDHIYPCVDIGVESLVDDRTVLMLASVAGYPPKPFGKNWSGTERPFIYMVGSRLIQQLSAKSPG